MPTERTHSTLEAGVAGRILDRLAALEQVIPAEQVRQVLLQTGRINGRACGLTHEVTLWLVLAMGLLTHLPIRQVFRCARRMRPTGRCPARSSLCMARQRLGAEPLRELHRQVVRPLATPDTPGASYRGLRLMALDGTLLDVPDSPANQGFGRASGGRGAGAFPQVRKVSLVELGTHVEVALAIGGWRDGEQTLAPQLWPYLPPDALLLEDRRLFSYAAWEVLNSRVKLLVRVKSHCVLQPFRRLSDGSFLAKIYARSDHRAQDRAGIIVRVIEYTLDDPQRAGHGEVHRLITNLLEEQACPASELIELYHQRWEAELVLDEQKTHQAPRCAGKAAQLRSATPEGVLQELYALSLGHFVVRALMLAAAGPTDQQAALDVDRLSFSGCYRILQCRLAECDGHTRQSLEHWTRLLLAELRTETTAVRRNRINPRVIKRKMSRWPKKRPHHRHPPPLLKSFSQSIVMIS
jgi:hypothetical protein